MIFDEDVDPEVYVEEHGLKTRTVTTVHWKQLLETGHRDTIRQAVADYKGGKEKALGALVGQTMKAMKGKANPGAVNKKLREMLA